MSTFLSRTATTLMRRRKPDRRTFPDWSGIRAWIEKLLGYLD